MFNFAFRHGKSESCFQRRHVIGLGRSLWVVLSLCCVLSGGFALTSHASTVLVSVGDSAAASGTSAGGFVMPRGSMSADGTKVVFASAYPYVVAGDTNQLIDIFVRDLANGTTQRVNVSNSGEQANDASGNACLSADGTKVAFESVANNLVSGDTNGERDIFVHDLASGVTSRVSVSSTGMQANRACFSPNLNANGTKVVFESLASNLNAGDTNVTNDIFVRDLTTGVVTRASVSNSGAQGTDNSSGGHLSADGTKVAFASWSANLVSGDTNNLIDVFVRDLAVGMTRRVSVSSNGSEANSLSYDPALSADGTRVAFISAADNLISGDTNGNYDVFVCDLATGTVFLGSKDRNGNAGNGVSNHPSLNANGTKVAFDSSASNLIQGDTNNHRDVFVRDLTANITIRASVENDGTQSPVDSENATISQDGTKVAFKFKGIVVRDLTKQTTTLASVAGDVSAPVPSNGDSYSNPFSFSADGQKVAFESVATNLVRGDTNDGSDIFVRDLSAGVMTLVSVDNSGVQITTPSYAPSINADGTKVAFFSDGKVFVRDLAAGTTTLVSVDNSGMEGNGDSSYPSINADGTKVAFESLASNLVAGDTNNVSDVFVRNLAAGMTRRVSINNSGLQGNGASSDPSLNGDGTKVAFKSLANNLFSGGDFNTHSDIFVHDLTTARTTCVSVNNIGVQGNYESANPSLSADGTKIAFESDANNFVSGDSSLRDVFLYDLTSRTVTRVSENSNGEPGDFQSTGPSISADGKRVAFSSRANNLATNDIDGIRDVFVRILATGVTLCVNFTDTGAPSRGFSDSPSLNADGTGVAYYSIGRLTENSGSWINVYVSDVPLSVQISDATVTESNGGTVQAVFTIKLSETSSKPVTVIAQSASNGGSPEATVGSDYLAFPATKITFNPGQTSKTVSVSVLGDKLDEADEKFAVNLSDAVNAVIPDGTGIGTIVDNDDPPTISVSATNVTEGNSGDTATMTFTLKLSDPSPRNISVQYQTANSTTFPATSGTDYTAVPLTTVIFQAGETTKTVTVTTKGDVLDENNERVRLNLLNPVNAAIGTISEGIIVDDDATPSLSINDLSVNEGNSGTKLMLFTVTLSAVSGRTVTVNTQSGNGGSPSAMPDTDYAALALTVLTFTPGQTTKQVSVVINGDTGGEANEKFGVILSGAANATIADNSGIGTILNDDASVVVSPPIAPLDDAAANDDSSG